MYASVENLWSVLFTTGYLTQLGKTDTNTFQLAIPNMEIRKIFTTQIMAYFKKNVSENREALEKYCNALKDGNSERVEKSMLLSEFECKTVASPFSGRILRLSAGGKSSL